MVYTFYWDSASEVLIDKTTDNYQKTTEIYSAA
jgi:hypothetical protein